MARLLVTALGIERQPDDVARLGNVAHCLEGLITDRGTGIYALVPVLVGDARQQIGQRDLRISDGLDHDAAVLLTHLHGGIELEPCCLHH